MKALNIYIHVIYLCSAEFLCPIGIVSVSYLNSQHHMTQHISTPNITWYEYKVLKNPSVTFCLITLMFFTF